MEWTEGRKLAKITYNNKETAYEYNHEGLRIKKTLHDGSYILYDIVDGVYVGETRYNASGSVAVYIRYILDEGNSPVGISLWYPATGGWTDYHFIKNLQGDVLEVYKVSDGSLAASYTYDSWGNILSQSGDLCIINPFRYRSYYYDTETWFYYLQSRYYDPAIGRFINADSYASTGQGILGHNMFAYCNNNPVMYYDATGNFPVAMTLLYAWVFGDGSNQYFDDNSYIAMRMKTSKKLKEKIDEEIHKFCNGVDYGSGSVHFTSEETDLWLAVRRASYEMIIAPETREVGIGKAIQTQTRYIVQIKVSDTYDFNVGNESWDGIGSWLNNLAYHAHEHGMGNDFYFEVNFTYETQWE